MIKIFSKIARGWQAMSVLGSIFQQSRHRIFTGTFLMLVSRAASLVLPASTKFLGDEILTGQNYFYLRWIALAVGISTIFSTATGYAITQILGKTANEAVAEMRKKLYHKALQMPVSFFNSISGGELLSRIMNDAESIRILVSTGLGTIIGSLLTMSAAVVVLLYLDWFLTLIIFSILLIFGVLIFFQLQEIRPFQIERSKRLAEIYGNLGESISGIRIIKAYAAEKRVETEFSAGIQKLLQNSFDSLKGTSRISVLTSITVGIIGILIVLIGGSAVQNGTMSLGDFLMFVSFTLLLGSPIAELASIATQITDSLVNLERMREVLEAKTEIADNFGKQPLPKMNGSVEFENVHCRYEKKVPVLQGVSFHVKAGTTIALVGSSGSGKSTILNLLLRFIKPTQGKIKIDEQEIENFDLYDYRRHFGVVLQDDFLFDGTIAENINFADSSATLQEIVEVCQFANAAEFIEKMPDGYQTVIGERGVLLSGGQRQRLAIARALLANPRILILDEATSSLDSESEALIQEGLSRLRKGRTTFVIAHRLSTIRSADQILVVEAGKIIERGTHDELIEQNNRYRQLYDKQYRFEQDLFVNPGEDSSEEKRSREKRR